MSETNECEQINEYIAILETERDRFKDRLKFVEAENARLRKECDHSARQCRVMRAKITEAQFESLHIDGLEAQNEFLKDQLLDAHSKLDKAELPFVMREEPPDRPGLWLFEDLDGGKQAIDVDSDIEGWNLVVKPYGRGDLARSLKGRWGSAPLPVGEEKE